MTKTPKKPSPPRKPTSRRKAPASKPRGDENAPRHASYRGNPAYRGAGARTRGSRRRLSGWLRSRRWWASFVRLMFAGFILAGLALIYFAAQLPDIRALDTIKKEQGITIESADGRIIANYGDVYGRYIPYEQLPKSLVLAVIATEDRRFFEHHGVDFFGIARAMVTNLIHGRVVQGGSTVTQQVAKNVFLTPERNIKRKLQEALLAFWLEARFSKKEIMAIYLNRVYLGGGSFGIDAASRRYFNKSAREINLYESALLAGLLKAPSRYSPAANTDRAQARVHQVLLNMVDAGFLKKKDVAPTMANYAKAPSHQVEGGDVRYYSDWIVDTIPEIVGQVGEDMIVTTTMDAKLQTAAQDALQNIVSTQGEKKNVSQGALVAMRPDGAVVAMVGGLNYAESQFNRAAQAKRQPGSVFKLFVYLAALEAGLSPQSTVEDAPITLQVGNKIWSPGNYESDNYRGEIPMVEALRYSLNTVSVRLSQYAGVSRVAALAMRLGIPNVPARPSIALGAVEASLLEMTTAYAHMANGGEQVKPFGISRIRTRDGKEIYKYVPETPQRVLAKGTVEMMNYMLLDVVARGTGTKAALPGRQAAGKTGTSQDFKDAWFIGFTPQLVTGVWVGNDNNKPMKKITGGSIPATIWHDFMIHAMEGQPVKSIPASAGSSEGLLPWLFGGTRDGDSESSVSDDDQNAASPPASIPDDSPFGVENDGNAPLPFTTRDAPAPTPANSPEARDLSTEPARFTAPAPLAGNPASSPPPPAPATAKEAAPLSTEFWNKLADQVPEKRDVKVEYDYPGERR